jgi:Fur family peroxide stress response transcriptional regulator
MTSSPATIQHRQNKLNRYFNALKQVGLRMTAPRRAICEFLAATDSHPSPYQVYAALSEVDPDISRATVYNTLNTLQQLGAIIELSFGADQTHYEMDPTPHLNLICLRCHSITDSPSDLLNDEVLAQLTTGGFQPVSARIDVVGFCAGCQAQRRAEIRALAGTGAAEQPPFLHANERNALSTGDDQ